MICCDIGMQIVSTEIVGPNAGVILKRARTLAGMSQRDAGVRCQVARSVFSDYERGARDPSIKTLRRLLNSLGFDVSISLVRRVTDENQLQGPIGQALVAHLEEVVDAVLRHGATRVWAVGPVVEGLEHRFDGLRLRADLPPAAPILAVMADVSEIFKFAYSVVIDPVPRPTPDEDPDLYVPDPPSVELTAAPRP